jgi:hypothetical protein
MRFDHTRSSKEIGQLLDYIACAAIGVGIAHIIGVSWVLGSAIVIFAFKYWKKNNPFLNTQLRVLVILTFCLFWLGKDYTAYCAGVAAGCDAANSIKEVRNSFRFEVRH